MAGREELTVEVCRERAEAFRSKADSEAKNEKKDLSLALGDSWKAIADGLALLTPNSATLCGGCAGDLARAQPIATCLLTGPAAPCSNV